MTIICFFNRPKVCSLFIKLLTLFYCVCRMSIEKLLLNFQKPQSYYTGGIFEYFLMFPAHPLLNSLVKLGRLMKYADVILQIVVSQNVMEMSK